jgi:hypothetical protein
MIDITPARRRALLEALDSGFIMRAGGFGDGDERIGDIWREPNFDRALIIDRLIVAGLMEPAGGFNQYRLTQRGREIAERYLPEAAAA